MNIQNIHIDLLMVGDTILHEGEEKTVSGTDLKVNEFMGITVFGDSYHLGYKKVKKIIL